MWIKLGMSAALSLATLTSHAHELWLERDGQTRVLYYGHHSGAHEGAKRLPYPPQQVQQSHCLDSNNQALPVQLSPSYPVRIAADCALTTVRLSSGYWSKTPYGTHNLPKDQVQMAVQSWLSYESVKRLDAWHSGFAQAVTAGELELLPLDNPLVVALDDKLRLRLVFQGQAVTGAVVTYAGKPRGATDAAGEINIRLKQPGLQQLEASHRLPGDGIKADEIVHTTSLVFELRSAP